MKLRKPIITAITAITAATLSTLLIGLVITNLPKPKTLGTMYTSIRSSLGVPVDEKPKSKIALLIGADRGFAFKGKDGWYELYIFDVRVGYQASALAKYKERGYIASLGISKVVVEDNFMLILPDSNTIPEDKLKKILKE